jgi:diguanylate cyclase (GGDEF)-like protein
MSNINVILGCLLLRRATQEFSGNNQNDVELFIIFLVSLFGELYFRHTDYYALEVIFICSISLYLIIHIFNNAYQYMIKSFSKVYSLTITSPLIIMGCLVVLRIITTLFHIGNPDLRQSGAMNAGFLIVMMFTLIGFNSTAIGLVISKMITQIKQLSQEDPLTKIFNRRHLNTVAEEEINKVRKNNSALSVVLLDIDHFKKVNDVYGHAAGDAALVTCVEIIKKSIRSTDYIGRLGGEEFCILLPNTTLEDAKILSERIRENIASHNVIWEGHTIPITASFGVTAFSSSIQNEWSNLLNKADIAMYQAKNNGRNQVVLN